MGTKRRRPDQTKLLSGPAPVVDWKRPDVGEVGPEKPVERHLHKDESYEADPVLPAVLGEGEPVEDAVVLR